MNLPKNLSNPLFDRFWAIYPKGYKGSKQAALKAWNKLKPNGRDTEVIILAVNRQIKERGWRDGFGIPHCSTYLNQARFLDEPIEDVAQADSGWQKSEKGIMAKGKEIGLPAEAGWSMDQYKQKILNKLGRM